MKPTSYSVRYRTPDGASRSKTFPLKRDAEDFLIATEHSKRVGEFTDRNEGRVAFQTYAEQWIGAQPHRATTAASVESIRRAHVYPTFGNRQLASIRTSEIQAWISGLRLAPSTVRVVYGKVAAIFAAAVEDRLIAPTPCTRRVKLPRPAGAEVVPMSPEQVR